MFSQILDLWKLRRIRSRDDLEKFATEIMSHESSLNLTLVDLRPDNPAKFHVSVLRKVAGVRNPAGRTAPVISTLGDYPDESFTERFVLPAYLQAKETQQVQMDTVRARVLGRVTAYDRLLLPAQTKDHRAEHALALINMRFSLAEEKTFARNLRPEEWAIIRLICSGSSDGEIAERLGLSILQIIEAKHEITRKLGADNIIHAVALAVTQNIVPEARFDASTHTAIIRPAMIQDGLGGDERGGILLVDWSSKVLSINSAALEIITGGGLHIARGYLGAEYPTENMALHRLISACARAQPGSDIGYAIASRERRLPLALLITRWAGPEPYHDQPAVRIFVADPERAPLPSAVQIQKQFGLTSAEARVALEIVLAESVSAVAVRLGVGVGTVKTHLVRVFSKTGTRRQSELARLLFAIGHAAQQMIR